MKKAKYGIRVPLACDDYIWVTEPPEWGNFDLQPVLYDSRKEAKEAAKIWGPLARVEEYKVDNA